jgi:Tfp pilus assembly protein PilP
VIIRRNWVVYISYLSAGIIALGVGVWLASTFVRKSVSAPHIQKYVKSGQTAKIKTTVFKKNGLRQSSETTEIPEVPVEPMPGHSPNNADAKNAEIVPLPPTDSESGNSQTTGNESATSKGELQSSDSAANTPSAADSANTARPGNSDNLPSSNSAMTGSKASTALPESVSLLEPFVFDTREGRRNPFKAPTSAITTDFGGTNGAVGPLSSPLERYELDEVKLSAILWDITNPKAMFLDPTGEVHILAKDDRIGRRKGYIAAIRENEVVVIEITSFNGEQQYSPKIISIEQNTGQ